MSEFEQPKLDDGNSAQSEGLTGKAFAKSQELPTTVNSGKTDALSLAVANARKVVAPEPEKPKEPGKYQLSYAYNGEVINETHETIPLALSRIAALKRLGIVPATSVRE